MTTRIERTIQVHHPQGVVCPVTFRQPEGTRMNQFWPLSYMRRWKLEPGKQYRVTIEEVDTGEYI